jgi:hypothetical protein
MTLIAAAYLFGTVGLSLAFIAASFRCQRIRLRVTIRLLSIVLLLHLWYLVAAPVTPGLFSFLIPYERLGDFMTTDLDGNEIHVRVDAKSMSSSIPPGELPRLRLSWSGVDGTAVLVHDTGWRFSPGDIRPIRGGLDVYEGTPAGWGWRFLLRRNGCTKARIVPPGW